MITFDTGETQPRVRQAVKNYPHFHISSGTTVLEDVEEPIIEISLDGDMWCALVGANIQDGVAGFGNTRIEALEALCQGFRETPYNLHNCTLG